MTETLASMVDLAFAIAGEAPPREYRRELATALLQRLPWLADRPGSGVHRLNVSAGAQALLSQRTRLTLRVPRERAEAAAALEGTQLALGPATLRVGAAQQRELLPWGTLYAHFVVAAEADDDELAFLQAVDAELAALGVACRPICGRAHVLESGVLRGYSLMLDQLSAADSLRVLETGVGAHRRLGCGLFVPHRSAAAVGAPP